MAGPVRGSGNPPFIFVQQGPNEPSVFMAGNIKVLTPEEAAREPSLRAPDRSLQDFKAVFFPVMPEEYTPRKPLTGASAAEAAAKAFLTTPFRPQDMPKMKDIRPGDKITVKIPRNGTLDRANLNMIVSPDKTYLNGDDIILAEGSKETAIINKRSYQEILDNPETQVEENEEGITITYRHW